ncbi:MAG TPA: hypothetical protein VJZ00_05190 [Thermoanaerobaculia bacterium]|nr:hypothetical protein [Thermoanaerobaculia bacterium]
MKRTILFAALVMLSCSSLFAEDTRWRVSVLAAEISEDSRAGTGVGIAYAPVPQWDVELTVASRSLLSPYTRLFYIPATENVPGSFIPATEYRRYTVRPIDVALTRHFLADQVISPYLRAGVRYVQAPRDPSGTTILVPVIQPSPIPVFQLREGFGLHDRTSTQAGAGVRVRLTPRTALRAEVTRLLRSERADFDPLTRYAAGVSWAF